VPCDVIFTVAPEITEPVLSETVPDRLPFDWLNINGLRANTANKIATGSALLLSIDFTFATNFRI
jgi:hypothetical protein